MCEWLIHVTHDIVHALLTSLVFVFHPISRETLLGQLTGYVRSVREEFTTKSSYHPMTTPSDPTHRAVTEQQATPTGENMPDVVNNIVWCRQLEAKTNDIVVTAEHLLGELAGFERFQGEANELTKESRLTAGQGRC